MNWLYLLTFVFGVVVGVGLTWILFHLECRPRCYDETCRWNGRWLHTCATWDRDCIYHLTKNDTRSK